MHKIYTITTRDLYETEDHPRRYTWTAREINNHGDLEMVDQDADIIPIGGYPVSSNVELDGFFGDRGQYVHDEDHGTDYLSPAWLAVRYNHVACE